MERRWALSRWNFVSASMTVVTFLLWVAYVKLVEHREAADCLIPKGVGPGSGEIVLNFALLCPILIFQILSPNDKVYQLIHFLLIILVGYYLIQYTDKVFVDYLRREGVWQRESQSCELPFDEFFPEGEGWLKLFFVGTVDTPIAILLLWSLSVRLWRRTVGRRKTSSN